MSAVIGISFGNTSSSIAFANGEGKVEVIANPDGDRSIPSTLAYVGEDEYHGQQANAQLIRNSKNTIINFRDFIGKTFDEVNTEVTKTGAPAIKTADGSIGFNITRQDGKVEVITVAEATKRHLKQLQNAAEDFLGKKVEGAVITVPTDFTEAQREELIKLSNETGLKVHQLINEPSSALLSHLTQKDESYSQNKIYLVADFGGIRSDAAIIAVRGGILTVLSTLHDKELGGDRLDEALMEFFAKDFEKKYKVNPRTDARSLAKLRSESIVVKKTLSNVQSSTCSIESVAEGIDYHTTINRLRYELTIRGTISKMTGFVEKLVERAELIPSEINEILLVGGSSNTPKLSSELRSLFPESTAIISPVFDTKAILPNELICRGAALQAALIESFDDDEIKESLQPIVVNTQHLVHSIGIKDADGKFVPIVVSETAYPIKRSLEVTNGESSSVLVELYEGKKSIKETVIEPTKVEYSDDEEDSSEEDEEPEIIKEVVEECGELLGSLSLKDLKPASKLEIIINITQDGKLHISSRELKVGSVATKVELEFK
ncbi:Hsp70 protein that interacts with Zuo1p [Yamadazyma tenuis]|uniref:HSP70-domain-containing protein n=1 Tax=Candida tenuis (strain ATCC 10573 / BCRC 21748 / CBS 615 / JCM 9827 / NBRC 10315 / NRRL Y-1498 / VKM Y-70) TaxID=590646 RepID=G3B4E7_CANTC|nr:HSP70-domain-containing protein [Yamadazyma tenuis ATCC 10573]EGV63804.1 HSP70-domain-containing protein [Yamadazyma tenuis ATCC 10573]WEJ96586.1 Hsp70 protein that interacts with Zuo1p [Yamadazyma tenuis]